MSPGGPTPRLSVSIVTFQQVDYVQAAIESVFAQRTRFPIEIVVGDDASTDGTQEVLRRLAADAPCPVQLLLVARNHGDFGLSNYLATIGACRGEYIALLDGDDYWSDVDKLQRQVDFLDAHPQCALCAHRVEHRYASGLQHRSPRPPGGTGVHGVERLLIQNFAEKISTVFRHSALERLPDWYRDTDLASADWVFNLLITAPDEVGFIDRVMAVHRKGEGHLTARYGVERLLADRLRTLERLAELWPAHLDAIEHARRRIRWKRRLARMGQRPYLLAQRLYALPRARG